MTMARAVPGPTGGKISGLPQGTVSVTVGTSSGCTVAAACGEQVDKAGMPTATMAAVAVTPATRPYRCTALPEPKKDTDFSLLKELTPVGHLGRQGEQFPGYLDFLCCS